MTAQRLRVPALVALATGTGIAGAMPAMWSSPEFLTDRAAVALVIIAYVITATLILVVRPGNTVARVMVVGTLAWAAGEVLLDWGVRGWTSDPLEMTGAPVAAVIGTALRGAGWLLLILGVPLIFPDGATAWPKRRFPHVLLALSMAGLAAGCLLAPEPLETRVAHLDSPTGLPRSWKWVADLVALTSLALAAVTLVVAVLGLRRKWRTAEPVTRQQLLWFGVAFTFPLLCLPIAATPLASPLLFAAVSVPTLLALGVGLLQRRLYDIELVASRSLTYLLVSIAAVTLYAGTIASVGILLGRPGAEWLAWVGAAVVALVFTPLRLAVGSIANRVTYGHWSPPADVLAATQRRLDDATHLPGLVVAMASQLAELLRLTHLEVVDLQGRVVCRVGSATDQPQEEIPLLAHGSPAGTMRWARTPLGSRDRRLLETVARQLGEALRATALVEELRRSQERLVAAREEERRRLRRDLHDGLGPTLAALGLEVDRLRNRLPSLKPPDADAELVTLRSGIHDTVVEVRRVVEGLRPPALDELGLAAAVEQLALRLTGGGGDTEPADTGPGDTGPGEAGMTLAAVRSHVSVTELPDLPAATEVAAYRIVQEAMTNVVRHAAARQVWVSIGAEDEQLTLEVRDDGHGRVQVRDGGVGLAAMRERAEEVGGTLRITSRPGAGVTVTARLPIQPRPSLAAVRITP